MKCVIDLENHIQQIFGLENFYLISNGHYIPSTEDINILQQDDVVVAIPKSTKTLPVCTSTPLPKHTENVVLALEGKRKRKAKEQCENEEATIAHSNSFEDKAQIKKKKKKKDKTDISKKIREETIQTGCNNNDFPKIIKKCKKVETPDIVSSPNNGETSFQEKQDENKRHQKSNIQNISYQDCKSLKEKIENESDNSVKKKVLYFEKHSHSLDLKKTSEVIEDKIVEDENKNQEYEEDDEISASSTEETGNNLDFRQKKLLIQKRNRDLISYDLPKKSNIVKSILVTNGLPEKPVNVTINIPVETSNNSLPTFSEDLLQKKIKTFTDILKDNVTNTLKKIKPVKNIGDELKEKPLSELLSLEKKERQIQKTQNFSILENRILVNMQLDTVASPSQVSINENVIEPHINSSNKNILKDESFIESEDKSMMNETCSDENKHQDVLNSFIRNQTKQYNENDKASVSTNNTSFHNNNTYSERSSSASKEKEVLSENQFNYLDTPSFITRRKRKRSHRKSKSKVSTENTDPQLNTTAESYRRVLNFATKPSIHIKFSDDEGNCVPEGTVNNDENHIGKLNLEDAQNSITAKTNKNLKIEEKQSKDFERLENDSMDTESHIPQSVNGSVNISEKFRNINENMGPQNELESVSTSKDSSENHIIVCDDSIGEMAKAAACSTPLITEDIIMKSPFMRSTKPKNKDIVAFKILRLSKDYTPEVSKYIVGEVRSFNEENQSMDVNIIDGLDQCKEPDGKFSIEKPDIDCKTIKTYCWNDLLEPRLIFP
ncbi:putative coilin N-terminus [Trypoxylus dichotomus]